jgi:predicted PurR-regulated permease PerM
LTVAFWVGALAVLVLALWLLSSILLPFAAGLILAYFLDPLVDQLEEHRVPRGIAAFLVLVLSVMTFFLVLLLLVPLLQSQIIELVQRIPRIVAFAQRELDHVTQLLQEKLSPEDVAKLRDAVSAKVGDVLGWVAALLQGVLTSSFAIVNLLSLVFITPIVTFFLLRDWDRMVARVDECVPRPQLATVRAQARLIDETLAGFIRGQATVCIVLAVYYAAALSLAGLDFGLAVGFVSGLLTFIPFVGAALGGVLSIGLATAQFQTWTGVALVAGIFILGQTVEGNVLTPKLVGDRVHLHPVWVIFALLAFGALFGFVGVLLAVPLAAVGGVLVRFALSRYLQSSLYDPRNVQGPTPLDRRSGGGGLP